jgi:cytochrome c5
MRIKISSIILFLPVFFVLGCDSGQDSPVSEKAETTQAPPVATEEATAPIAESTENDETIAKGESEPVQQAAISGKQVYQKACVTCHKTGVANAPKLGDAAAWAPRIAKGKEALYSSSLNGVSGTAMVAKGGCGTCSDEELHAAVDYMVSSAE